jgi:hypothetical protein
MCKNAQMGRKATEQGIWNGRFEYYSQRNRFPALQAANKEKEASKDTREENEDGGGQRKHKWGAGECKNV